MGLQIGEIITKNEIEFSDLKGKTLAVDAFNTLYQFLTTIRQIDGTPLKDSKGNITSHLSGLFYRNMKLISEGIKLIYVFDGRAPHLKEATHKKRKEVREEMQEKYNEAKQEHDLELMGKYAAFDTRLDDEKIKESKELLEAMGIAVVQAPGEGEAQASVITKKGLAYATASQDYDCLMFGCPLLIQNLSMARKRKTPGGYKEVFPQIIKLESVLAELDINLEQLICIGIICGTDYNIGGIKGLGPKKALKIVQEYKTKEEIFSALENDEKFVKYEIDFDWMAVYNEIARPDVVEINEIKFPKPSKEKVKEIMLKYEFSAERIDNQLKIFDEMVKQKAQRTLF